MYACGNIIIYLEIYVIYAAIMKLNCTIASLFLYQWLVLGNNITSYVVNYAYYSREDNIDCAIRTPCKGSLLTHDKVDKVAYLNQATT